MKVFDIYVKKGIYLYLLVINEYLLSLRGINCFMLVPEVESVPSVLELLLLKGLLLPQ
jgi:hypothetical protein